MKIDALIVFFAGGKMSLSVKLAGGVGIDRVGKVNETSGAETDGTGRLSPRSRSVIFG